MNAAPAGRVEGERVTEIQTSTYFGGKRMAVHLVCEGCDYEQASLPDNELPFACERCGGRWEHREKFISYAAYQELWRRLSEIEKLVPHTVNGQDPIASSNRLLKGESK